MSYIVYINGEILEVASQDISFTKQVNDIGKLSDRQSNHTNKFKAYRTARTTRALNNLGLPGNDSNVPYQKNEVSVFDADTGECIIFKGQGVIKDMTDDSFELYIYDGLIDFYKAIENFNLSDIGISDLNHLKNTANVVATWEHDSELPYIYLLADYGGKNFFDHPAPHFGVVNIDYLIPWAKIPFIWNKIFEFFGFTYTGSVFESERFQNWLMTYPKPVTDATEVKELISTQLYTTPLSYVQVDPTFYGINYVTYYEPNLMQACFSEDEAESVPSSDSNCRNFITLQEGLFTLKLNGFLNYPTLGNNNYGISLFRANDALGTFIYEPILVNLPAGQVSIDVEYSFQASTGERFGLVVTSNGFPLVLNSLYNPGLLVSGNLTIDLNIITGNSVNFETALIDFKVSDFFNEVLNHFGLTVFKNRFSKNLDFKQLRERLQTDNILDWSNKNPRKTKSKFVLNNYGQENLFKYKYNSQEANYNDGKFLISDKNIADSVTVFQSRMFTIEKEKTIILGESLNIYKFWDKQIKNDLTIEYKELENRFYFSRAKRRNGSFKVGSEAYGDFVDVSHCYVEDYFRLRMQDVINDHYATMASILNKAKVENFELGLKFTDVSNFDFKALIYLEQYGSYYIVNKFNNFRKNQPALVEMIEVDYFTEFEDAPIINNGTFIESVSAILTDCVLTITFDTDAELPTGVRVVGSMNSFGGPSTTIYDQLFNPVTNTLTINLPEAGLWELRLFLDVFGDQVFSSLISVNNLACAPPPVLDGSFITLTSIQTITVSANTRTVRIFYNTDFPNNWNYSFSAWSVLSGTINGTVLNSTGFADIQLPHMNAFGLFFPWTIELGYLSIHSNPLTSNS